VPQFPPAEVDGVDAGSESHDQPGQADGDAGQQGGPLRTKHHLGTFKAETIGNIG
jgi:hypothetical protein